MGTVSVKEVIARIIRNNRSIDMSYIDNIYEWIAEGMYKLNTTTTLTKSYSILNVKQYCASKPCDFVTTVALSRNGARLLLNNDERAIITAPIDNTRENIFNFTFVGASTIVTDYNTYKNPLDYSDVDAIKSSPLESRLLNSYQENNSYFIFPFEEGEIELTYYRREVDEDGFPLITDNENYKTALYWYVLTMLIGAGYDHPNKEFSHSYCLRMFEMYGRRAINELHMPTTEQMEMIKRSYIRLLPKESAYEEFFSQSSRKEKNVR